MSPRTLSDSQKRAMQEGRKRARELRPQRLAKVEAEMDQLGAVYLSAKHSADFAGMREAREAIYVLGRERVRLQEGGSER